MGGGWEGCCSGVAISHGGMLDGPLLWCRRALGQRGHAALERAGIGAEKLPDDTAGAGATSYTLRVARGDGGRAVELLRALGLPHPRRAASRRPTVSRASSRPPPRSTRATWTRWPERLNERSRAPTASSPLAFTWCCPRPTRSPSTASSHAGAGGGGDEGPPGAAPAGRERRAQAGRRERRRPRPQLCLGRDDRRRRAGRAIPWPPSAPSASPRHPLAVARRPRHHPRPLGCIGGVAADHGPQTRALGGIGAGRATELQPRRTRLGRRPAPTSG